MNTSIPTTVRLHKRQVPIPAVITGHQLYRALNVPASDELVLPIFAAGKHGVEDENEIVIARSDTCYQLRGKSLYTRRRFLHI